MYERMTIQPDLGKDYAYLKDSKVKQLTHSAGVKISTSAGLSFIYCSGKTATDDGADTAEARDSIVGGDDIGEQTRQVCRNIQRTLAAAGATMADIVRVRVYVVGPLTNKMFAEIHDARSEFFEPETYPASTLVVVAGLARAEARIEIDADAIIPADEG